MKKVFKRALRSKRKADGRKDLVTKANMLNQIVNAKNKKKFIVRGRTDEQQALLQGMTSWQRTQWQREGKRANEKIEHYSVLDRAAA